MQNMFCAAFAGDFVIIVISASCVCSSRHRCYKHLKTFSVSFCGNL